MHIPTPSEPEEYNTKPFKLVKTTEPSKCTSSTSSECECNWCGQKKKLLQNKKYCSESSKIKLYRECKECNYIMSDMYFSSDIPVCDLCDMCDESDLD